MFSTFTFASEKAFYTVPHFYRGFESHLFRHPCRIAVYNQALISRMRCEPCVRVSNASILLCSGAA